MVAFGFKQSDILNCIYLQNTITMPVNFLFNSVKQVFTFSESINLTHPISA